MFRFWVVRWWWWGRKILGWTDVIVAFSNRYRDDVLFLGALIVEHLET